MDKELFLRACREAGVPTEVTAHIRMHIGEIAAKYDELSAAPADDAAEGGQ